MPPIFTATVIVSIFSPSPSSDPQPHAPLSHLIPISRRPLLCCRTDDFNCPGCTRTY
jgi:hypothetical protein